MYFLEPVSSLSIKPPGNFTLTANKILFQVHKALMEWGLLGGGGQKEKKELHFSN